MRYVEEIQCAQIEGVDNIVSLRGENRTRVPGGLGRKRKEIKEGISPAFPGFSDPADAPVSKDEFSFNQSDVQLYYDAQVCIGTDVTDALEMLLVKFGLKASDVEVTPAGWVLVKDLEVDPSTIDGQMIPGAGGSPAEAPGAPVSVEAPAPTKAAPASQTSTSSNDTVSSGGTTTVTSSSSFGSSAQ